ncbi:hypothetical protein [Parasediminibacterium sp. JCM 36343]|uniref:hypothetical protein n=1 Tax=Parasediminibacterium sp. JCM 36343 TaxID=3374279 RepID=UPI0039798765
MASIFSTGSSAGITPPPDTATTQKMLHYILAPLNKTQVPRGFLQEYGCPIFPLGTFNGKLSDSNKIDINLWRTLYFQLQTSYCGTSHNPLPDIKDVNKAFARVTNESLPIPLPILIGNYSKIKADAFRKKLLVYDSVKMQVHDAEASKESPYEIRDLFIGCPSKAYSKTSWVSFVCDSSTFWNTSGKNVYVMAIDFGDGRGFRTITLGVPMVVNYNKAGRAKWTIKAIMTDSTILQCYSSFYVSTAAAVLNGQRGLDLQMEGIKPAWGNVSYTNPTTHQPYNAQVYIKYSRKNTDSTLRKPLIIAEGFDASSIAPLLQPNYAFKDFIKLLKEPTGFDLFGRINDAAAYDMVYVDFEDGTADISMNAKLIEEVIRRVNQNKVADKKATTKQENIVMGMGMGGLCARYGLAEMTKNKENTETRLLITHDSPHHGLNLPLGLQFLVQMMDNINFFGYYLHDIYPEYNEAINILKTPAMVQMLVYRASGAQKYNKNSFLDGAYKSMVTFSPTDSQPTYRFIATSLGNECGNAVFTPGTAFINQQVDGKGKEGNKTLFFSTPIANSYLLTDIEAFSIPKKDTIAKIAHIHARNQYKLFGFININKDLYDVSVVIAAKNFMAIDGVAGSTINLHAFPDEYISTPQPNFNLNPEFPLFQVLSSYAYPNRKGTSASFTYIPTASALDVSPMSAATFSEKYVNGINQHFPSSSETFIAQETNNSRGTTNNVHATFTARNAEWLYNEMENKPNLLNCPYNGDCANNYYILGDTLFCKEANFIIPGLPRGSTVKWSVTGFEDGAATIIPQGVNKVKITKKKDGYVALHAVISKACKVGNGSTSAVSKSVYCGLPKIIPINSIAFKSSGPMNPPIMDKKRNIPVYSPRTSDTVYSNMRFVGSAAILWADPYVLNGPPARVITKDAQTNCYQFFGANQLVELNLMAQNQCGYAQTYFQFVPKGRW